VEKDVVYLEKTGAVAVLFLNQPKKKNAISAVMMDKLSDFLTQLDNDDEIRVIVLRGEGEHFTVGGDLSQGEPGGITLETSRKTLRRYNRTIRTIRSIGKPVIAMADGYVVGGGISLILACDLICASDRVKLVPNFCKIGLVPEMGVMVTLQQVVGPQRAKEILLLGGRLTGEEGVRLGFINRLFPAAQFEENAMAFAQQVAEIPSATAKITKGIMNGAMDSMLNFSLEAEAIGSPFCSQTAEFKEASARFIKG